MKRAILAALALASLAPAAEAATQTYYFAAEYRGGSTPGFDSVAYFGGPIGTLTGYVTYQDPGVAHPTRTNPWPAPAEDVEWDIYSFYTWDSLHFELGNKSYTLDFAGNDNLLSWDTGIGIDPETVTGEYRFAINALDHTLDSDAFLEVFNLEGLCNCGASLTGGGVDRMAMLEDGYLFRGLGIDILGTGETYGTASAALSFTITHFSTTPYVPAVPEPATWLMMIMGFGLAAAASRRRRQRAMHNAITT